MGRELLTKKGCGVYAMSFFFVLRMYLCSLIIIVKGTIIMAIVYHEASRLFNKSKFLTGEENNIYGEGFYFAFNKNISRKYAKAIFKRYLVFS